MKEPFLLVRPTSSLFFPFLLFSLLFLIISGKGFKKLMQIGRPVLPKRLFDRDHAKLLTMTAAEQIEKMVRLFQFFSLSLISS